MITLAANERIQGVSTTDDALVVAFVDGRILSVPLVWYPRLLGATSEQRSDWRLIGDGHGVHWPQIDEDLSAAGLLRGVSAPGRQAEPAREVRNSVVHIARDFYSDSLDEAEKVLESSRSALVNLIEQLPESLEYAHTKIHELIDSYEFIENALDEAAQMHGVEIAANQTDEHAQHAAGQVASQAQELVEDTAQQAQETAGSAAQQAQNTAGGAATRV